MWGRGRARGRARGPPRAGGGHVERRALPLLRPPHARRGGCSTHPHPTLSSSSFAYRIPTVLYIMSIEVTKLRTACPQVLACHSLKSSAASAASAASASSASGAAPVNTVDCVACGGAFYPTLKLRVFEGLLAARGPHCGQGHGGQGHGGQGHGGQGHGGRRMRGRPTYSSHDKRGCEDGKVLRSGRVSPFAAFDDSTNSVDDGRIAAAAAAVGNSDGGDDGGDDSGSACPPPLSPSTPSVPRSRSGSLANLARQVGNRFYLFLSATRSS